MKLNIFEQGTEVLLVSRQGDDIIVPRKNETIIAHGKRYFVREVSHYYHRALTGNDDSVEVMVEEE